MTRFRVAIGLACIGVAFTGCASKGEPEAAPAAAAAAPAPAAVPMVESTATSLNIRATASPTGAVVGSLKKGERANAPQPEAGGWIYVESASGAKGYVASKYVKGVAPAAAPAPAAAAPAATPPPAQTAAPAEEKAAESGEPPGRPAPPGSKLAKVTVGMTEPQVVEIMGAPTTQQNYITGKAFIPFYYGPDTSRLDYRYKGVGIIVFTRNRYSNQTEVIRIDYDPNEDGVP